MSGMFQSEVQARIEQKVHAKYVRYVARHRQRTWCFSDGWRNFARSWRRQWNWGVGFFRSSRLWTWLLLFIAAIAGTGITLALAWGVLWVALEMTRVTLLDDRQSIFGENERQIAEVALTRFTILHTLAWLGIAIGSIWFGPTGPDSPKRKFLSRAPLVRDHRSGVLVVAILLACLTLIGGWIAIPFLPGFWPGMSAFLLVGLVLGWSNYWISRWLSRVYCPNPQGTVIASLGFALFLSTFGLLPLLWGPRIIELSTHLAWLGPLGWLYHQVVEIGIGGWGHSGPLLIALGLVLLVSEAARRQVLTWGHRRRVLSHALRSSDQSAKPASPNRKPATNPREIIRDELRRVPNHWLGWIWPTWLAERRRWYVVVLLTGLFLIGTNLGLHAWLIWLADGGSGRPLNFFRPDKQLSLTALAMVVLGLELIGFGYHDCDQNFRFLERPITPWQNWRQSQWQGLIRMPTLILHAAPFLIVPLLLTGEESRYLPPLTLALTLCALVVLRTMLIAGMVTLTAFRFLMLRHPSWIGELTSILLFLAIVASPFVIAATVPKEATFDATVLAEGGLQAITLVILAVAHFLLALATELWRRASRLPPISHER